MEFCLINEKEYKAFWQSHPLHNFLNSPEAMHLKRLLNQSYEYVGVKEGDKILCAACLVSYPIMKFMKYYSLQRGILIDYGDISLLRFFVDALKKYVKKQKGVMIKVDPEIMYKQTDDEGRYVKDGIDNSYVVENLTKVGFLHDGFKKSYDGGEVMWIFTKDLRGQSEEDVLKNLDQQTRWSINRSLKDQIQVRELDDDELDLFVHMESETAKRRGFTMRSEAYYHKQKEAFESHEKVLLAYLDTNLSLQTLIAEKDNLQNEIKEVEDLLANAPSKKYQKKYNVLKEALALNEKNSETIKQLQKEKGNVIPLATSVFIVYDFEIVYLFSATYDAYRKYNAPYAIQWYMLKYALQHNIPRYNFYGISGNFASDAEDYGVYKFKKGFTGRVEQLVGKFTLPIRKIPYLLYQIRNRMKS